MSCKKAWTVFQDKNIAIEKEVDAKKETKKSAEAWELVSGADTVFVANGQKVLQFKPAEADREELLKKITGRTGNLRAPALQVGDVFYIGFNQDMYSNFK
ncbi:MAG: hypothetical protein CSB23_01530 [Deltaproteobacteria bacterium]|nr:MAG: hypothetical protein CSB23_01530 [Deltaproteobacteria bacterium]